MVYVQFPANCGPSVKHSYKKMGDIMKQKRLVLQLAAFAAGVLLLGALGAFWPQWVGASSDMTASGPTAIIADAVTYQGYLTDENGEPLTGNYTMRFQIYNAAMNGTLLWDSNNEVVSVTNGLFTTEFGIDTDIFNGEALWLSQTINGELLTPRQEILPAPLAHSLRPGAIIKGTASAIPNNYSLEVHLNNDTFAFNRGAITGQASTGNAIYGLANNGRAIYGQTRDGYAVYGFDGGSSSNRGYGGYFYSTNGIGLYAYSNADRSHPNILAPGIYGQSNRGVGVYGRGDTSDSSSFYNEGGYFEGGKGLYARGTDPSGEQGYGARIYSSAYRGLYVLGASGWFDAYFAGDTGISTNGIIDRSARSQSLVVNLGETSIQPGDLVAMVGVTASPENGEPMLGVAAISAENVNGVVGVAATGMEVAVVTPSDAAAYTDFSPRSGPVAPGDYLVIITAGLAPQVNVESLVLLNGKIGDKIALTVAGEMRLAEGGETLMVIGRIAGDAAENGGTIPLFIDID